MSLEEQIKNLAKLPPQLAGYAVLRRMHELDAAKQPGDATSLGISAQRDVPTLAVGVELARRFHDANEMEKAGNALGFAPLLKSFEANEWALAREAAQLLEAGGRAARALEMWRILFATPSLPRELRIAWLSDARKTALAAKDVAQAHAWQIELEGMTAEPKR